MSAATAIHMVAMPSSASRQKAALTSSASVMFCHSRRCARRDSCMVSGMRCRSLCINTTSAVSMAMPLACAPPMAKPMSAAASAGASLMPSPAMAVAPRVRCSSARACSLSSGSRPPRASSMPTLSTMARTVVALSPLKTTGWMPSARSCATACAALGRSGSATAYRARTAWASISSVVLRPCACWRVNSASSAALIRPRSLAQRALPNAQCWPSIQPWAPRPGRAL